MKKIYLIMFLSVLTLGYGCSKDKENPCSTATNVDNAECQKNIKSIDTRTVTLDLNFVESYFYYSFEKAWKTVTKDNLNGGIMGVSVPIYSSFLNMTAEEAVVKIEAAKDQKTNPANYLAQDLNQIPYVEVEYQSGLDYVYNYVKKDLEGSPVASVTGKMIVKNNRAYLPFINAMFGNQFYSSTDIIGKRYIHSISISAQSSAQSGSTPKKIEFESTLEAPIVDFSIAYSTEAKSFNLDNRFQYYYMNNTDGLANNAMPFFTLTQSGTAQATPVDIKILFKERPVLKLKQELFFELPFNLDKYKTLGTVEMSRGDSFYVQNVELNSTNHFKMKVKMNDQVRNLIDGREFTVTNFPANKKWDLDVLFDFSTNSSFSDPQGIDLITPLKPTCNEIVGTAFKPLKTKNDKATAAGAGGYYSACHPDLNQDKYFSQAELANTTLSQSDVYYGFFNYVPMDTVKNVGGHLNGLRTVTFALEGCMRVYVKTPTDTDFKIISQGNNACVSEGDTDTQGWVYFKAEKTYSINDLITNYETISGLKAILQSFSTKPIRKTPYFKFNGLINNTNHIY